MLRRSTKITVKNRFEFTEEIVGQNPEYFMTNLDNESLFTSTSLEETTKICCDSRYKNQENLSNISKNYFEKLLRAALAVIIFFDSIVHQQRDGVAMDSLFGARLGIAFLAHYKQIWLNVFPDEFNPVYYKRYVDDIPDLFDLLTILKNLMNI